MSKRVWVAAAFLVLIAGAFTLVAANGIYTIPGKWYGYITDNVDLKKGANMSPDAIRAAVAKGAKYAIINGMFFQSHMVLEPADIVAPYAGQTAFVEGTITTNSLLKGAEFVPDSDDAPGVFTIKVTAIQPHKMGPGEYYITGPSAGVGSTTSR